jgi:hypothetical protein
LARGLEIATMSNDAKLGLVVGLGLVLTIGLVFHRRDPSGLLGSRGPSATPFLPGAPPAPISPASPESGPFTPAAEPPPLPTN